MLIFLHQALDHIGNYIGTRINIRNEQIGNRLDPKDILSSLPINSIISGSRKRQTRLKLDDLGDVPKTFDRTTEQRTQAAQGEPKVLWQF